MRGRVSGVSGLKTMVLSVYKVYLLGWGGRAQNMRRCRVWFVTGGRGMTQGFSSSWGRGGKPPRVRVQEDNKLVRGDGSIGPGFVGESEGVHSSVFLFIMRTVSALAEDARLHAFCVAQTSTSLAHTGVFGLALSLRSNAYGMPCVRARFASLHFDQKGDVCIRRLGKACGSTIVTMVVVTASYVPVRMLPRPHYTSLLRMMRTLFSRLSL